MTGFLFESERIARCRATLAHDLAATVVGREARLAHLETARSLARALPGSLNETLLIRN